MSTEPATDENAAAGPMGEEEAAAAAGLADESEAAAGQSAAPPGTQSRDPRRWWVLGAMCFALFVIMLDNTVVNVAIPTIRTKLGASLADIQWIIDAYTLALASLMLTGGTLGDLYGRKKAFIAGMATFVAGSVMAAVAPSATWLIIGRAVSGIGAAALLPCTLAIITATFDPDERATAIGTWAGVSALALAIGPMLGGYMVEGLGWQSVFWLNLPVGAVGIAVVTKVARESRDETGVRRLDLPGLVLATVGLLALVYAVIETTSRGWGHPVVLACLGGAAVTLGAFVAWELKTPAPMLELRLFRSPAFTAANAVALVVSFAAFGIFLYISLFIQNVQGYSPSSAGLRFMPMSMVISVVAPISGRLADRIGSRVPMTVGLCLLGTAMLLLSGIDVTTSYWYIAPAFLLIGVGMALTISPMTAVVMKSVDTRMAGIASGIVNTFRQAGGTFGVAVLGTLIASMTRSRLPAELSAAGVPEAIAGQAADAGAGLTGGSAAVQGLPPEVAQAVTDAGKAAFTYGVTKAMLVSATLAFASALVAAIFIRRESAAETLVETG